MSRFHSKIALVTGALGGIGRATADLLRAEGAFVAATDLAIGGKGGGEGPEAQRFVELALDVTDESAWKSVVSRVVERWGRLDILVNNAGIMHFGDLEQIDAAQWRRTHAVNLDGVFYGTLAAIAAMKSTGGGSIVNISSVLGVVGDPRVADYASAKAAVRNFTKSAALHCAHRGYDIRINSVHPGYIRTDMILKPAAAAGDVAGKLPSGVAKHPIGRLGLPEEVAQAILFLASDQASFITGAELAVDGGYLAQ